MSDLLRHKTTDQSAPPAPNVAAPRARNSGRNALGVYSSHFMTPSWDTAFHLLLILAEIRPQIHDMIVDELQEKRAIKWYCVSKIRFSRETPTEMWNFEALVEPLQNIPDKIASHIPCGYTYLIIGPNGLPLKPVTVYRGSDAVNHLIESIAREKDILAAKLRTITPMHMTT
ncbi:hypothetical protein AVEN_114616-1 [Araneus ventricosus]|uniref:Uncharacterized protein n=1 Tax=Araneus ventricosus TaxID=182803 RepID=A0A4Y2GE18_ARAVE|nr:hypothetical protein AVEN_114616-1 [Araneus ventricosus]